MQTAAKLGHNCPAQFATGVAHGLGAGSAASHAAFGARVHIVSRNRAELDEVVGAVRANGTAAVAHCSDVTDRDAANCALENIDDWIYTA
ncbi:MULTISPECIES: SDR family NAD(P)-dependent oxidoreductase [Paraburkholderia]|uniref:SDR family NAD(P)-dependent oxidoreductase n=1 Tax=Paraburkholderia TaxID=1822464 RepID=UPI000A036146|nr:hypothetical protein C9I56_33060 [Paraburkholderia caribensis]